MRKGGRPPKPNGVDNLGHGPAIWKLTEECWSQSARKRPDTATVLRRFQDILSASVCKSLFEEVLMRLTQPGEEKRSSPFIDRIRRISLSFDSVQHRINRLDQVSSPSAQFHGKSDAAVQDLEKGVVPENEKPAKLSELCMLCGTNKLIPDSMKLNGYGNDNPEVNECNEPFSVHQGKFKGRTVAITVTRLYISRKLEDHLGVSVVS